jgi:apolipoprotein N-acyltransferase
MTKIKQLFNKNNQMRYNYFLLSILSGIFIGTTYIPFPAWAIGFCYIPLWYGLAMSYQKNEAYKMPFWMAWSTQFILTMIGFNWIYYTATEFGHLPSWLSFFILLLLKNLTSASIDILFFKL